LSVELTEKTKRLGLLEGANKEMASQLEDLNRQLKMLEKYESENTDLKAEVNTLQKQRFDQQEKHQAEVVAKEQLLI